MDSQGPIRTGLAGPNKVVLARLDGVRLKGHIYDFSLARESFHFFPGENPIRRAATTVRLCDLKAIFFVRDFKGDPSRKDARELGPAGHGRGIRVTFQDGETIVGTTESFVNTARLGFFLSPADRGSNNLRIFVVTRNAREITKLTTPSEEARGPVLTSR